MREFIVEAHDARSSSNASKLLYIEMNNDEGPDEEGNGMKMFVHASACMY